MYWGYWKGQRWVVQGNGEGVGTPKGGLGYAVPQSWVFIPLQACRCHNISHICNPPINYLGSGEQQCISDQFRFCGSLPVRLMMEASPAPMMIRHTSSVQKLLAKPQPTDDTIKMAIPQPAGPSNIKSISTVEKEKEKKRICLLASI